MSSPEYNEIFAVPLVDGRVQVFAIDTNFQLWSRWMESGAWTDWSEFQMPPADQQIVGVLKICGSPITNGTQLWATDMNRVIWTCWKTGDSSAGWTVWSQF